MQRSILGEGMRVQSGHECKSILCPIACGSCQGALCVIWSSLTGAQFPTGRERGLERGRLFVLNRRITIWR